LGPHLQSGDPGHDRHRSCSLAHDRESTYILLHLRTDLDDARRSQRIGTACSFWQIPCHELPTRCPAEILVTWNRPARTSFPRWC